MHWWVGRWCCMHTQTNTHTESMQMQHALTHMQGCTIKYVINKPDMHCYCSFKGIVHVQPENKVNKCVVVKRDKNRKCSGTEWSKTGTPTLTLSPGHWSSWLRPLCPPHTLLFFFLCLSQFQTLFLLPSDVTLIICPSCLKSFRKKKRNDRIPSFHPECP